MAEEPLVEVKNLGKKYCRDLKRSLYYGMRDLASEVLLSRNDDCSLRKDEFWALRDVSFQLERGEMLGIIGSNGAGKSTLLKLLNGLIKPNSGEIVVRGRIGALIALGTGFNPVLTGRENIYINAAVLGIPKRDVDARLDEIIDFAEIGDFINAPVRTYSSGMRVRLGYSVAAHLSPDLLLVDEVLSVGDASFRERCYNHLNAYRAAGGSVIFVSHNTQAVETTCERVIWLNAGAVVDQGASARIVGQYEQDMLGRSHKAHLRMRGTGTPSATREKVAFEDVACLNDAGDTSASFRFGEPIVFRIHYRVTAPVSTPHFVIGLRHSAGEGFVSMMATNWQSIDLQRLQPSGVVECRLECPNLAPGNYQVHVGVLGAVSAKVGEKWYTPLREQATFTTEPGELRQYLPGLPAGQLVRALPPAVLRHQWNVERALQEEP